MNTNTMRIELIFTNDILGTAPSNEEVYTDYIASNAPDASTLGEEIAAVGVDEVVEKGKTIFPKDSDGTPIFWTYQIKGFFKSACKAMSAVKGSVSSELTAYKKYIDTSMFVYSDVTDKANRKIRINTTEPITDLQRPLRASTMQGERVALANSECIKAGATCWFDIVTFSAGKKSKLDDEKQKDMIREWLEYGQFNGIGQWRNAGFGSFVYNEYDEEGNLIGGNA